MKHKNNKERTLFIYKNVIVSKTAPKYKTVKRWIIKHYVSLSVITWVNKWLTNRFTLPYRSLALSTLTGTSKTVLFVITYCPPGPYSEFLPDFSNILSDLVLSLSKIIILGDFNIHVDSEKVTQK